MWDIAESGMATPSQLSITCQNVTELNGIYSYLLGILIHALKVLDA